MSERGSDQQIYAPPGASLGVAVRRASPRLRFWLACASAFFLAPTLFLALAWLDAPAPLFPAVALVAWLGPLVWVLASHIERSGGRFAVVRVMIVAVGLTLAMAAAAFMGLALGTALVFEFPRQD